MNTDSPRVVLRSGSLYFGAWPPSLRERPWRGVHLHGRVRSRGSNGLFSHVECGTHGTHGCSQIFVAAFAERFRKRATGPYPVFSVKLKRKGKSGWYQSSTVWLCQVGARRGASGDACGKRKPLSASMTQPWRTFGIHENCAARVSEKKTFLQNLRLGSII